MMKISDVTQEHFIAYYRVQLAKKFDNDDGLKICYSGLTDDYYWFIEENFAYLYAWFEGAAKEWKAGKDKRKQLGLGWRSQLYEWHNKND
jgi:hypothetical protein